MITDVFFTTANGCDGVGNLCRCAAFGKKRISTGIKAFCDERLHLVHTENRDFKCRLNLFQPLRGLQSVNALHVDINHGYIQCVVTRVVDGIFAVVELGDDVIVLFFGQ